MQRNDLLLDSVLQNHKARLLDNPEGLPSLMFIVFYIRQVIQGGQLHRKDPETTHSINHVKN